MTVTRMTKKILSLFLLSTLLVGCSTVDGFVPERYQLWADDGTDLSSPELSDIPNATEIEAARDRADTLRAQLEADRENARRAAMGLPVTTPEMGRYHLTAPDPVPQLPSHEDNLTETQAALWYRHHAILTGGMVPDTTQQLINKPVTVYEPSGFAPSATDYYQPDNIIVDYDAIPDSGPIPSNNPVIYDNNVQYRYFNHGTGYTQPKENLSNGTSYMGGSYLGHGSYVYASEQPSEQYHSGSYDSTETPPSQPLAAGLAGMIFFDHGSANLSSADKTFLGNMAQQLENSFQPVRIIGHASSKAETEDPVAATKMNLTMSLKRATSVMEQLHQDGIPYTRMAVFAHGSSQPLWDVEGKTKEEAARRVEVYVDQE